MPCPSGVNIPSCFEVYNKKYLFHDKRARLEYIFRLCGVANKGKNMASLCVKCGVCEEKCPQNIAIPKNLEAVAKEFEGPLTKPLAWLVKMVMKVRR